MYSLEQTEKPLHPAVRLVVAFAVVVGILLFTACVLYVAETLLADVARANHLWNFWPYHAMLAFAALVVALLVVSGFYTRLR